MDLVHPQATATMDTVIIHPDAKAEVETVERCHILELSNFESDEAVSIARARVEPGVTTALHRLRATAERYVILEGEGMVELGGAAPKLVTPGDVVVIPPDVDQCITNTGKDDLVFLAICTPRFLPQNYVDAEFRRRQ
jgi:mannose-6-phosphate isomerase-like protein (cupin superfamily)